MNQGKADGATILVVDDTPANISVLLEHLGEYNYKVLVAEDAESALEQLNYSKPDLILLDIMMPGMNGFETCKILKEKEATKDIPIIFMTALSEAEDKVIGFNLGGVDYITNPFQHEEVLARVSTHLTLRNLQISLEETNKNLEQRVIERTDELSEALTELEKLKNRLEKENKYLQEEIKNDHNFDEIIGNHPKLNELLNKIQLVAPTDSTVLINGETGTGKELIARAIHDLSKRKERPLVKVNCGAISSGLVESELFGHEKGAFTGAMQRRAGRFELADGGTIFLDEVGELPADTQVKLLRVLQEQEFERVGGSTPIEVDVRVIAATNKNLSQEISAGNFRSDLFYRLNVFPLETPPLRDRPSDIPVLVDFFLDRLGKKLGKSIKGVTEEAMKRMIQYSWPGNIRELQNCIERAAIVAQEPVMNVELINDHETGSRLTTDNLDKLEDIERELILKALKDCNWQIGGNNGAANRLGRPPSTIRDRVKKLGIEKPRETS